MMVIQTMLPIFAVIGIGWISVRAGYLDHGVVAPAAQVVMRIALPAMIFLALAGRPVGQSFDLAFLLAYGAASLTMLSLGYGGALALGLSRSEGTVVALGVSMANSAFMGFPIGQAIIGQDMAIRVFAHVLIVENLVILPLVLLALASADRDGGGASECGARAGAQSADDRAGGGRCGVPAGGGIALACRRCA